MVDVVFDLNCFDFFHYCFNEAFVGKFITKLSIFNTKFQNSFQDVVFYEVLQFQTCYQIEGSRNIT